MASPCIAVMPVYNEESCVEAVCREWLAEMRRIGGSLVAVDDGSRDATPAILAELAAGEEILLVIRQENAGHGPAVLRGYRHALASGCAWVFQVDSDGEVPAESFRDIWLQRERAPILLGRRVGRRANLLRSAMSTLHRRLLTTMFGVRIADPNVPFRLMRAADLGRLMAHVPPNAFAPNVFLALLAARAGILGEGPEVPVAPRAGGTSSIHGYGTLRIAARCGRELWDFRRRQWRHLRENSD
ncbi:MAG: glycosyltransferase family 2 protein [Acidobacteria bacterium]|nr:glycosyltransferase family 2 protein [Acidobacteriota bacterium]